MTFLDLLSENGISYIYEGDKHCRPGWVQMECPFCGRGSGKFHLGYSLEKGYLTCWKCGGHSVLSSLSTLLDIPYKKARGMLEGIEGVRVVARESKRGTLVLPKNRGPLMKIHREYLRGRGFDPDEIVRVWHVEGIGLSTRLSWRIFIPWEHDQEIVSWNTRAIKDTASLRYHGAGEEEEAISRKSLLYGEDLVSGHGIGIVEGELDAWAGGPGWVATGGTALSRSQILRMSRYLTRVICFDAETEAQKRARKLADELSVFPGETLTVCLDDGKDLASTSARELRQLKKLLHG